MLRPSNSILGSSRAARRASVRYEATRFLGQVGRALSWLASDLAGSAFDLVLLASLPLLYLASAYLSLDLPVRWLSHRERLTLLGGGEFLAAAAVAAVGISRAVRGTAPVAPVRPRFARTLLGLAWAAALLLVIADAASARG